MFMPISEDLNSLALHLYHSDQIHFKNMMIPLGTAIQNTIDYPDALVISNQLSTINYHLFTMQDPSQHQSIQDHDDQIHQPGDFIRQDYSIRVSEGQQHVIPNTFEGVGLPLAMMIKPDYANAVNMTMGMCIYFGGTLPSLIFCYICLPPYFNKIPIPTCLRPRYICSLE